MPTPIETNTATMQALLEKIVGKAAGGGGGSAPSDPILQEKTVTPTKAQQTIIPDSGYNALSKVTVEAIPAEYITTTDADAAAEHIAKDKIAYVNGKKVVGTHTDPTISLANGVLSIT